VKARLVCAAPLLAAILLYAGGAVPLRALAGQARDAYREARRARQQAQSQLAPLERRETLRRQAAAIFAQTARGEGGPTAALRRSVLATLEGSGATAVRLGVRPGSGPTEATVRVSAVATFPDAVRLSGELAGPGTGLILQHVRLEPRGTRRQIAIDVEAVAPPGGR
jgi:hypothetical protein